MNSVDTQILDELRNALRLDEAALILQGLSKEPYCCKISSSDDPVLLRFFIPEYEKDVGFSSASVESVFNPHHCKELLERAYMLWNLKLDYIWHLFTDHIRSNISFSNWAGVLNHQKRRLPNVEEIQKYAATYVYPEPIYYDDLIKILTENKKVLRFLETYLGTWNKESPQKLEPSIDAEIDIAITLFLIWMATCCDNICASQLRFCKSLADKIARIFSESDPANAAKEENKIEFNTISNLAVQRDEAIYLSKFSEITKDIHCAPDFDHDILDLGAKYFSDRVKYAYGGIENGYTNTKTP